MIGDELSRYFAALGTRHERLFYFSGQDPYLQRSPAQSISALYWQLDDAAAEDMMVEGLIDVIGTRSERLPIAAIEQVLLAAGLIQRPEMLLPMAQRVRQRSRREPSATLKEHHSVHIRRPADCLFDPSWCSRASA